MSTTDHRLRGWWMRPSFFRAEGGGGCATLGPIQINWYNGFRIHTTWPRGRTVEFFRPFRTWRF